MNPRHLLAAILCAAVLAYALSVGPFVRYQWTHTNPPPPAMFAFYKPVIWLGDNFLPFRYALIWYVDLWIPTEGSAPVDHSRSF